MNNFGKSFIDTFSNNLAQDKQVNTTQPSLPKSTGINKKKVTSLQQNLVNVLSVPQNNNGMMQGA